MLLKDLTPRSVCYENNGWPEGVERLWHETEYGSLPLLNLQGAELQTEAPPPAPSKERVYQLKASQSAINLYEFDERVI